MKYVSKPTECEAMQWANGPAVESMHERAEQIVAWVNANGGEARHESAVDTSGTERYHPAVRGPRIAVRTINGWAYAKPGHYVVMGSYYFPQPNRETNTANQLRGFYPCAADAFERRWAPA